MKKIAILLCMLSIFTICFIGCGVEEKQEEDIARRMTTVFMNAKEYEIDSTTGEKSGYTEIYRNEYGLRYKITKFDKEGKEIEGSTNVVCAEEYDEQNRLVSYNDGMESYRFQYDEAGKINEIRVYNQHDELVFHFGYSDRKDAKYKRVNPDGYNYYYNEYLQLVRKEEVGVDQTIVWETKEYDANGLLLEEFQKTNDYEWEYKYEYDANGKCIKAIGYKDNEFWFENTRTYSEKGNLLSVIGFEFGEKLSPEGEEYIREEYTDEHYDERGRCNYSYVNGESGKMLVKNEETWTYEYDEEGWLKKEISNKGNYREFNEEGICVERFLDGVHVIRFEEYEIIDDKLLMAFYIHYGENVL